MRWDSLGWPVNRHPNDGAATSADSVESVERDKSSSHDKESGCRQRRRANELLASRNHPVFNLVSRDWLVGAAAAGAEVSPDSRRGIERALDLARWLDMYKPVLKIA